MATELPLDVQILIIEWAFRSSQSGIVDRATLRACALVCRAWTPTAQRLLFRRIQCVYLYDLQCNIRLIVSALSIHPHLAAHVRYIRMAWPLLPDYDDICLRLLELCRHVEGISFFHQWTYVNKDLSPESDARLRAILLRPVLLSVHGRDSSISTVVQMCSGARVLLLRAGYSNCPLPPTVEALEIRADSLGQCLWLSNPLPALRHLCLMHPMWTDEALCEYLISTGILPQLQSLQIKGYSFPPMKILEQLVQLKTLIVNELPGEHVTLPPTLRHIGYHTWGSPPGMRTELAVDPLRALPDLQLVTVTLYTGQHVRAALAEMCRDTGVDFGTYAQPQYFQQPQNFDWI
ncbi:hypothetical protein FA95DRAFT_1602184 [Auriscalpium vulgare]|uniref:Uncharacterized protein n=1 Tax=Auriscalpium vulgare TaxID=40419 RepID=A0ACB8S7N6_9AGAM|nr:hypothetical protein FA95DRAFT_1602184 [Auriscalpium vulgare]